MPSQKSVVVGIDLGTTNSVIAVPGQFADHGIVFGNVTVIWDDAERLTHASAVCKVDGELTVGDDAKVLASEGFTPVRFVKKYMGTEKLFRVGDEEEQPEGVSAKILKYLCDIVGQRLNVKVAGAVITHPAYFDVLAINATKDAGAAAGLKVHGLIMEPVAAAMAYCADDERQNSRALVYDLGGGTFDVTLIERSGNSFLPVAFGGNRELGGYNFDKKIAGEMLKSLREKGYKIDIDSSNPERDSRWATLMHHAERIKMDLSGEHAAAKSTARVPGVFKDDSSPSKSVQLNFSLDRKEFLQLIEPEIAQTMRETRKVIEIANLSVDDIDHLVLVGGSSRIFAIQQRLREEFGLDPQFDDDIFDLSVAVGAAMAASAAGVTEEGVTLDPIPEETTNTTLPVSGVVTTTAERTSIENLAVTIRGGTMGDTSVLTNGDGRFYVSTELEADCENELTITILDPEGNPFFERSVVVYHGDDAVSSQAPEPPKAMLPKPISVETESGFSELAPEGAVLPYKHRKAFKTLAELDKIPIDLFQEDIQLTTIVLEGFSKPVPANCKVELEVDIGEDYRMTATAIVPSASIHKTQEFKLKPPPVPDVETLRADFARRRSEFESQMENTPDGAEKARIGAEGDLVIEEIEQLLNAEFPEQIQVFMLIKRLYVLTKQLGMAGGLVPPKTEMDSKFEAADQKLRMATQKDPAIKNQNYEQILQTLKDEADRAYAENDSDLWSQVASKLDEIIRTLQSCINSQAGQAELPPAPMLRQLMIQIIAETRQEIQMKSASGAMSEDNAKRAKEHLDAAEREIAQVDISNNEQAQNQLLGIFHQHIDAANQLAGIKTSQGPVIGELNS